MVFQAKDDHGIVQEKILTQFHSTKNIKTPCLCGSIATSGNCDDPVCLVNYPTCLRSTDVIGTRVFVRIKNMTSGRRMRVCATTSSAVGAARDGSGSVQLSHDAIGGHLHAGVDEEPPLEARGSSHAEDDRTFVWRYKRFTHSMRWRCMSTCNAGELCDRVLIEKFGMSGLACCQHVDSTSFRLRLRPHVGSQPIHATSTLRPNAVANELVLWNVMILPLSHTCPTDVVDLCRPVSLGAI